MSLAHVCLCMVFLRGNMLWHTCVYVYICLCICLLCVYVCMCELQAVKIELIHSALELDHSELFTKYAKSNCCLSDHLIQLCSCNFLQTQIDFCIPAVSFTFFSRARERKKEGENGRERERESYLNALCEKI